ncbi:MAG: VOC family protein [Candidatus Competibacteraceae bacterium]|nr:VOC family protein [Candidatus Competibacteraceae bacterium]
MALTAFDHVNLRTTQLEAMTAFYCDVLGLRNGPRPPFPFPGAWLYLGEQPVVHLVGIQENLSTRDPSLEHFAFSAEDMATLVARLEQHQVTYEVSVVPGWNIHQVNVYDPDGNHLHIDFSAADAAQMAR